MIIIDVTYDILIPIFKQQIYETCTLSEKVKSLVYIIISEQRNFEYCTFENSELNESSKRIFKNLNVQQH